MQRVAAYCLTLLCIAFAWQACHGGKTAATLETNRIEAQQLKETKPTEGPRAILYKTTEDYSAYVPATMNAEKTRIVSYPDPSDVYYKGKLAKPTALDDGYWLDNRGVSEHSVFLNYTYEEYAQLKTAPSKEEMKKNILAYHPFIEIVDCGARHQYKEEVKELNQLIKAGLPGCRTTTLPGILRLE